MLIDIRRELTENIKEFYKDRFQYFIDNYNYTMDGIIITIINSLLSDKQKNDWTVDIDENEDTIYYIINKSKKIKIRISPSIKIYFNNEFIGDLYPYYNNQATHLKYVCDIFIEWYGEKIHKDKIVKAYDLLKSDNTIDTV